MLGECLLPIRAGATSFTQPHFDPGGFLKLVEQKKPSTLYFVPTMLRLVLDHPDAGKTDFSSVRYILTGTAPLPHDSVVRTLELWPHISMRNSYGMSEGGIGVGTRTKEAVLKPGCVGKMPPHMQIRDDDGNPVTTPLVVGEIYGKQGNPRRYWRDETASSKGWVDGWTKTGDLGYVDEDGDLIISGRSKELIIRGGYNITPIEIENVLHDHPAVKDAAVVGVSHEVLGDDVAAAIVLLQGATATAEELQAFAKTKLADNKVPRTIVFFDALPLNANAKVLKRELKPLLQRAADERRAATAGA
jgi:acyl-CoA synthetase (AMP-forming)/AMP-acid ligase II